MKYNIILLLLILLGLFILTFYWDENASLPDPVKQVPITTTQSMQNYEFSPNATLHKIDETIIQLHDFKGKIVILNFWASWCAPCVVEFPQLLQLANKKQDDLVFIAVSVDANKENILNFFNKLDPDSQSRTKLDNVHIIWDPNKKITQDIFQTIRYPETYIIGPDLTIREKIIGASVDFSSDEFIKTLESMK